MLQGKRIGAVLLMGGEGRRFGGDVPKQFRLLAGKPIYRHALDALLAAGFFDEIVLVSHPDWMDLLHEGVQVVAGGATRQESSYLGLKALQHVDIALIHDAVRPFVTEEMLRANVLGAIEYGAVDTCIPSADTLVHAPGGKEISSIPPRAEYFRGQTPQTFRLDWILEAHERAVTHNATDDCSLVLQIGKPVHIVAGSESNLKITSEFDLLLANSSLQWYHFTHEQKNPRIISVGDDQRHRS